MVEWISQFVTNMQNIQVASLQELVRGLRDLSSLAAGNQGMSRQMVKHNQEMRQMYNRVLVLENKLEQEMRELEQTNNKLAELMDLNKGFMELNDADKLSNLKEYLDKLRVCMEK